MSDWVDEYCDRALMAEEERTGLKWDKKRKCLIAEIIQKSKEYSDLNKLPNHYQWIVKRSFELGQQEGRKEGAKQAYEKIFAMLDYSDNELLVVERIHNYIFKELEKGIK